MVREGQNALITTRDAEFELNACFQQNYRPISILSVLGKVSVSGGWGERSPDLTVRFPGRTLYRPPHPACRGANHGRNQQSSSWVARLSWTCEGIQQSLALGRDASRIKLNGCTSSLRALTACVYQGSLLMLGAFRHIRKRSEIFPTRRGADKSLAYLPHILVFMSF